jgi:hypothetical protein
MLWALKLEPLQPLFTQELNRKSLGKSPKTKSQ